MLITVFSLSVPPHLFSRVTSAPIFKPVYEELRRLGSVAG
jgi:hypothetical protein